MSDKQSEIFEKTEEEQPLLESVPEDKAEVEEVIEVKKIDGRRGKRTTKISEKQREQLLKNLAIGRARGLETRRKKAELKRIEKAQKNDATDKLLLASLQKRELKTKSNEDLLKKIADLENKLLTQQTPPTPPPTPKPKPAPPAQHKFKEPAPPPPTRPPTPTPTPVAPPKRSKKELAKLMRNLR